MSLFLSSTYFHVMRSNGNAFQIINHCIFVFIFNFDFDFDFDFRWKTLYQPMNLTLASLSIQ